MKSLSIDVAVAFHRALAEKALQRGKTKMAIYYYSRAVNEYTRSNQHGRYDGKIEDLQNLVEQLKMKERTNSDKEKKKISSKDSTRLTIEIDNMQRRGFSRAAT